MPLVGNADIDYEGSFSFPYNYVKDYNCRVGFNETGEGGTVTCSQTGSWSVPSVPCDPVGKSIF